LETLIPLKEAWAKTYKLDINCLKQATKKAGKGKTGLPLSHSKLSNLLILLRWFE